MLETINAYADHNFLIDCIAKPTWRESVIKARQIGQATLVLSPFHFYEIGNIRHQDHRDAVLTFIEEVKPLWIFERLDIQLREFLVAWCKFLKKPPPFIPRFIGSLADAGGTILDVDPDKLRDVTVRQFVTEFTHERIKRVLIPMLERQGEIAASNRTDVKAGRLTDEMRINIETAYLAQQIALQEGFLREEDVHRRVEEIRKNRFLIANLERFISLGFVKDLKTYRVETAFMEIFYASNATLSKNNFLDRQHAIVALAHCNVLVTGDVKLRDTCKRAKTRLPFRTASVESGEEFIARFASIELT